MIEMKIDQVKGLFFDRAKLEKAAERGFNRGMSRMGAFIRTRAISLILRHQITRRFGVKTKTKDKHKGQSAPPGEPPYSHLGLIAKFLFFFYDRQAKNLVVGPISLNRPSKGALKALEEGGDALVFAGRGRRLRQVYVQARPFMHPALAAELDQLPAALTDCIKAQ